MLYTCNKVLLVQSNGEETRACCLNKEKILTTNQVLASYNSAQRRHFIGL